MQIREHNHSRLGLTVAPRPNVRAPKMLKLDPFERAMAEHAPRHPWRTFGIELLWAIGGPVIALALATLFLVAILWVAG